MRQYAKLSGKEEKKYEERERERENLSLSQRAKRLKKKKKDQKSATIARQRCLSKTRADVALLHRANEAAHINK